MSTSVGRDIVDFRALLDAILAKKYTNIALIVVCSVLGVGSSFLLKPRYEVEALIAPARESNQLGGLGDLLSRYGGLASLAGIEVGQEQNTAEAIAMLSSRKLTTAFIKERDLMPILFADEWDEEKGTWAGTSAEDIPSQADALELFEEDIRRVEVDQRNGLITLAITWYDAELAVEWAHGLVDLLNRELRQQAVEESRKSLEFLNNEAKETSILQIQQAIYSLVEQEVARIMMANVKEEYALRIIDPALSPDTDDYVWPSKILFALLGLVCGAFLVLVRGYVAMGSPLVKSV